MTANATSLPNAHPYTGTDKIIVGNGNQLAITHIGNTQLTGLHKSLNLNDFVCACYPQKLDLYPSFLL
jgi:hypothetical protein